MIYVGLAKKARQFCISAETTLNIYSHITDTMQQQAAARIDREIAGADTPIPEPNATDKASDSEATDQPTEPKFEPYKGKIRKPGTGCVTMINDHLYEGRFSPRVNGKRIAKNIYATTREECEEKLKVLIAEMKKEIAEIKAGEKAINKGLTMAVSPLKIAVQQAKKKPFCR